MDTHNTSFKFIKKTLIFSFRSVRFKLCYSKKCTCHFILQFLSVLSVLALAGSSLAGVATYAYNPYAAYNHLHPAVTTYASPARQVLYQPAAPAALYHHAPVYTRSYLGAAPVVASAPVVKTVAPAVQVAAPAPVVTKTVVAAAVTPIVKEVEIESAPQYDFSYGVHDSLTGDIKSQVESRNGGNVAGSYSVVDADGYKRTVTYTADDLNGFNAVVQREPIVAKVAAVAAVATPAVQQVVAAHPVLPVQQQYLQYLPQQQQVAQPAPVVVEQQPAAEPAPVEYPELEQPAPEQPHYAQDQHFPPYPQSEGDDSDVVDVRSANNIENVEPSNAGAPAPVTEAAKEA